MIGASPTGKTLVTAWNTFYYSWSPPVAHEIAGSQPLKDTFKVVLLPLLGSMYPVAAVYHGLAWLNPDVAAVCAFIVAAILSISIYIALPALLIYQVVRIVGKAGRNRTIKTINP